MTNCNDNTSEVVKLLNYSTNYQAKSLTGQGIETFANLQGGEQGNV
jgi:hypothetical protein